MRKLRALTAVATARAFMREAIMSKMPLSTQEEDQDQRIRRSKGVNRSVVTSDDGQRDNLGYEQTLKRGIGALQNFAFGFTEVAVLASFTSVYGLGLASGGPVTMIWAFLFTWFFNTIVSYSMAELCGAYPSAGSVYHWSAQVAPAKYAPLASYCGGWLNFIGNAAGDASFASAFATAFLGALQAANGTTYDSNASAGIALVVLVVWTMINWLDISSLGWFNNLAALCHSGAIFVIIIAITATAKPCNTGTFVFTHFENTTGFSDSYAVAVGITTALFSFAGYEASAHMSEETEETNGSQTSAPKGIIATVFATGFGGFWYVLALLLATNDIPAALITSPDEEGFLTLSPPINVFIMNVGHAGGAALAFLIVINLFFAGVSSCAVTGRITYALMRDNAFPYSNYFKQVHPVLKSPIRAINFVCAFDLVLLCLLFNPNGGTAAFQAIVGLSTVGFQLSYALPILLKVVYQPADFPSTPMSLGRWSDTFGIISCLWLLSSCCLFFLPTNAPVTAANMNWLCLVSAVVFAAGAVYWQVQGRHTFTGPKRLNEEDDIPSASRPEKEEDAIKARAGSSGSESDGRGEFI